MNHETVLSYVLRKKCISSYDILPADHSVHACMTRLALLRCVNLAILANFSNNNLMVY